MHRYESKHCFKSQAKQENVKNQVKHLQRRTELWLDDEALLRKGECVLKSDSKHRCHRPNFIFEGKAGVGVDIYQEIAMTVFSLATTLIPR